jgi:succinate-acetate transporter protein
MKSWQNRNKDVSCRQGIADPGPLGLAAFALTTFAFSIVNAGFLRASLP